MTSEQQAERMLQILRENNDMRDELNLRYERRGEEEGEHPY